MCFEIAGKSVNGVFLYILDLTFGTHHHSK